MPCPRCQREEIVKAGFQRGRQRFKCKACGRLFVEGALRGFPEEVKAKAIALYLEGLGFRAIGRLLGVSNVAVLKWVKKAAQALPEPENPAFVEVLELDELHHYVKKRAKKSGCGLLLTVSETKQLDSSLAAVVLQRSKSSGNK
jgi:transposase-like protein